MTLTSSRTQIDVRAIAPRDRHPIIFSTFRNLGAGEAFELVSDHDPAPLREQFQAEMPGRFSWDYLQAGPSVWRVGIQKLGKPHSDGRCCGSCGGA
jgi:uncharacterized protein (DUF2249 family)